MPTKSEREYYRMGFADGIKQTQGRFESARAYLERDEEYTPPTGQKLRATYGLGEYSKKPKRKLSAWQQFVKKNSKYPRFKYKSGAKKGRINLKALGVAYRKTQRR